MSTEKLRQSRRLQCSFLSSCSHPSAFAVSFAFLQHQHRAVSLSSSLCKAHWRSAFLGQQPSSPLSTPSLMQFSAFASWQRLLGVHMLRLYEVLTPRRLAQTSHGSAWRRCGTGAHSAALVFSQLTRSAMALSTRVQARGRARFVLAATARQALAALRSRLVCGLKCCHRCVLTRLLCRTLCGFLATFLFRRSTSTRWCRSCRERQYFP